MLATIVLWLLLCPTTALAQSTAAGVAVSRRIGVGVEYSRPSAAEAFTTVGAGRAQLSGRQEERVLLGVIRGRIAGSTRLAVDAVGGAGVLFQHHEMGGCDPAVVRCEDTSGPALDERAPTFVAGVDVPIRLAPHFAVAADLRAYFLRRSDHVSGDGVFYPWQQEWHSSTRVAAAVSARLLW